MKKITIILVLILSILKILNSQQAYTLYTMDRVLQSSFVNPSAEIPYTVHVGGITLPILGQLPPNMNFNYANNSFHYNHIIHKGKGSKSDKLVIDIPLIMKKLQKTTNIRFENDYELINIGIKLEKAFITFALTEKIRFGFSLPYDMFELAHGNKNYAEKNKAHNLKKIDINFTHYREFALGSSHPITDKINIGYRAKFLVGLANVNTKIKNLSLKTDPDTYKMTMMADMAFRSSLPIYFDYEYAGTDSASISINEQSKDDFGAANYLLNMKNLGFGVDLGVTYKINKDIEVFGSITDLGVIFWRTNPQIFKSNGEYPFNGIPIKPNDSGDQFEQMLDDVVDSLVNIFSPELTDGDGYTTWLTSSIYLGGKYKLFDKMHLGALYRGEFYRRSYMQSLTLYMNSNVTKWFSTHLTYSIANNSFTNIGLGFTIRAGFVNWYFVTDNVIGCIWPQKARNLNFRMGCNMVFGYKERGSSFRYGD